MAKIAIVGTVGVPAKYGGFETLAENLVFYNMRVSRPHDLEVYCSANAYRDRMTSFGGARLRYLPLKANGKQAMFYDMWSLVDAAFRGHDVVILLGHGGSFVIPLLKLVTKTRFMTNIDGIEWRRDKWSRLARWIIRKSEAFAVRHSDVVIADNEAIRKYIDAEYGMRCEVIPYGGDHALEADPDPATVEDLPEGYALALCRIEPENNIAMILDAFSELKTPLVFVGNWNNSVYGRELKKQYIDHPTIIIHDPVYGPAGLRAIRNRATLYIHGHSAGGTNPSLVEMMHYGIPILAYDCIFNRSSTEEKAQFFLSAEGLAELVQTMTENDSRRIGADMVEIARRRYTWDVVGCAYYNLING